LRGIDRTGILLDLANVISRDFSINIREIGTQIKTVISMTFPPYKFRFTLSMPFILRRFSRTTLRLSAFLT